MCEAEREKEAGSTCMSTCCRVGEGGRGRWASHLCSVPDNRRPGVAQFVSTGSFIIVDQEKVILSHTNTVQIKIDH